MRTKRSSAGKQVETPHPVESFGIVLFNLLPVGLEIVEPCHQRSVVIRSPILPFFNHEILSYGRTYLRNRREVRIREDVSFDPRVGRADRALRADCG